MPFEIAGIKAGNTTRGHRFLGNEPFKVTGFADYAKALKSHKVILDRRRAFRADRRGAHALAKDAKLTLVEDDALLAENAGLTEWPTVLMGEFDKAFLEVPAECLTTSMKTHQKCFSLAARQEARKPFPARRQPQGQGRRQGRSSPATRR